MNDARSWFTNPDLRGLPLPPSSINMQHLEKVSQEQFLVRALKTPRNIFAVSLDLDVLFGIVSRLGARIGSSFDVSAGEQALILSTHLGAACPTCGGGLTGDLLLTISSMKKAKSVVAGDPAIQTILDGQCPHCSRPDYLLLWNGGGD